MPDSHNKLSTNLLIILGIVILACIAVRSALSVVLFVASSTTAATGWTGDFWSDEFPIILLAAVTGISVLGIYKLVRILRK